MDNRFETFTIVIAKIHKNIRKIKNTEMAKYDLKGIHVSIIYYLMMYKSLTARELREKCEEDKATISRAINYLEINNYVICSTKFVKRYNSPLSLTNLGKEVGNEILQRIEKVLNKINICVDGQDRKIFYNYLIQVSDKLDSISKELQ